jgi:hypothetical protein
MLLGQDRLEWITARAVNFSPLFFFCSFFHCHLSGEACKTRLSAHKTTSLSGDEKPA